MENEKKNKSEIIMKSLKVILGIFVSSIGAVFMYKATLGSVPQATIIEGVSKFFNLSYGVAALYINIFFLIIMFILDKKIIYIGTILTALLAGPLLDLANYLINPLINFELSIITKIAFVIIGSVIAGIGLGFYIREDFGIGALEGIMVILNKKYRIPMTYSKWTMDIVFVIIGTIMGAAWGIGTVISIIIVGPIMIFIINKKNKKSIDN